MTLKTLASKTGNGLLDGALALGTAINNVPLQTRIREIDAEIEKLQAEKDALQKKLI